MCHCLLELLFISVGKCNGKVENLFGNVSPQVFAVFLQLHFLCFRAAHRKKKTTAAAVAALSINHGMMNTLGVDSVTRIIMLFIGRNFTLRFLRKLQKLVLEMCIFAAAAKEGMGRLLWYLGNWLKAREAASIFSSPFYSSKSFNLCTLQVKRNFHCTPWSQSVLFQSIWKKPSICLGPFSGHWPSPWDKQGKRFRQSVLSAFH